ncbi:MAG: hypothetical protein VXZ97_03120 [Pseudomonadota bacterium]|jgi:hypothetical protein|nr:hypothetical protein [Pseudomonadota bacterium]|tara:strand:- start:2215 stop:2529 length:315 start_codon:yes stop_codon:yes gene_type:complete
MSSYDRDSNPYLKLNFWEFLALSTVMLLFFPWSILVCLALYGIEETKLIVLAVIEDFAKTLLMVIAAVATIVITIIVLIVMWFKSPDDTVDTNSRFSSEITIYK